MPVVKFIVLDWGDIVDSTYGCRNEAESKEKTWCLGPYAGVDYNLTLFRFDSRFDSNTVDLVLRQNVA